MRVIKLLLAYDGTDFVGWQRQAAGVSVQGLLEDALHPILGGPVAVHGAGRTDAGVHALGQVASFTLTTSIDATALARALNATLPPDVRILNAAEVADDFHARFSARGKVYEYRIVNAPIVLPLLRRYAWHVIPALDLVAIEKASIALRGTHDFAAFQGAGTEVHSTERTIHRLEWRPGATPDDPLVMEVEGNGFLRYMVRNIAGTLVAIGLRRWPAAQIDAILASRDRAVAGPTAPPQGLFLTRVLY